MVIVFTEKLYPSVPQLLTKFPSHVHACTHARKPLEGSEACLQVIIELSNNDLREIVFEPKLSRFCPSEFVTKSVLFYSIVIFIRMYYMLPMNVTYRRNLLLTLLTLLSVESSLESVESSLESPQPSVIL